MAEWTIYKKNGEERMVVQVVSLVPAKNYVQPDLEYSGTWMGECFVTLNFRSAYPIDFAIGDYIVYRGEKFVMNYDPTVVKKARKGTYGEGFTYENVKFNSLSYELTDVRMLDYVIGDNNIHYTGLPKFSFFCSTVDDLADRLQVNADRYCSENGYDASEYWVFVTPNNARTLQRCGTDILKGIAGRVHDEYFGNVQSNAEAKINQNVSIDNMSVWDACKFIKDTFGLNFIIRGRTVVIGAVIIPTSSVFMYGKGNGLYEIERHADEDQAVITKLFAYGSDKNLPIRYYANLGVTCRANIAKITDGGLDYLQLDVPFGTGIFTKKTEFHGVDAYEVSFVYNETTYNAYVGSAEELGHGMIDKSGFSILMSDTTLPFSGSETIVFTAGIDKDKWPTDANHKTIPENLPNNMAVTNLMLPGFPSTDLKSWVLANEGTLNEDGTVTWRGHTAYFSEDRYKPYILSSNYVSLGVREATKIFDGSDGDEEIYPTIEGMSGKDTILSVDVMNDNGVFAEGAEVKNFDITLPLTSNDIDLKGLLQGDTAIEMTSGYCGGRSFAVKSVKADGSGHWVCTCEREHDTSLDLWFPYSYGVGKGQQAGIADEPYQVRLGDKYVLTGIEMSEVYVNANAVRLLEAALNFLEKNEYVRYTYVPRIDELYMARQHDAVTAGTATGRSYYLTFKEGDMLLFRDFDLDIDGSVFIDTLRIKEYGNGKIPTYEVTLRNDKQVGTIQRMQEQLNSLTSSAGGVGGGGGGSINVPQVRQLIQAYGSQLFLSKVVDDIANGVITFARGLRSKMMSVFEKGAQFGNFITGQYAGTGAQIDEHGKIEAQALTLREYLEVPELRFNRAEIIAGNTTQTPCGGIIDTVTPNDGTNPPSGYATLKLEDGEIGKIAVGDLCMGYWHDVSGNSEHDTDDRQGRMTFSGFKTVYFMIDGIPELDNGKDNTDNHFFHYTLRPEGDDLAFAGGNGIHPFPMMHFAGRGNSTDKNRQGFTIHTPRYTARLADVSTWKFYNEEGNTNYTYVNGDLTGFGNLIGNPVLSEFGTIDMNIYMKGHIIQVDNTPDVLTVSQSMMGLLNKFDTQTVTFKVMDGYRQDHTAAYSFSISRSSGNAEADVAWKASRGNVGRVSEWTMSYADLGDADLCEFTVEATATDMPMLSATFLARKNNNLRYFLTLNTDLIHIDMNGEVIGNGNEPTMTTGNDEGGESFLQLNGNYLTTGNTDNVYKIIARAWRVGASNTVIAESIDGLTIRATKYTGNISESGGTSDSGRLDLDVDFSCDKYIIELLDKNAVGVVYDVKTVLIVRDGSASIVADFDDEMGAGAATSDGTVLAGLPYTSIAHLYRGSAIQNLTNVELVNVNGTVMGNPLPVGWGYEETTEQGVITKTFCLPDSEDLALKGKDITVSLSYSEGGQDATLTLSKLSKESPDNNKFGVRLTAGSEANTAYFYFNKFKAGSDGHVTLFQLAPDTTNIKVNKQGQYSVSTVIVDVLRIDVDETGQTETNLSYTDFDELGLTVKYKVDGASTWTTYGDGGITVGSATTKVELKLEQTRNNETIEWDTETIPVVRDGLDSNYIMKFADSNYEPTAENIRDYYYDNFAEGRNWAIMSSDGGSTWNGPYPIIGEEGAPGGYTEFSFGISNVSITNSATTPPSDIGANDWHDGIISVTEEKPYLWMRQGTFTWNGSTFVIDSNGYTYARVKGLDAPDRYELEVSDTTFQIGQDDTTYTPSEIYVRGVVVKADGTRTYLVKDDWQNGTTIGVTTTVMVTRSDDTTATYTYNNESPNKLPNSVFDNGRIKIKTLLSGKNIDIADVKSITMSCDFKKSSVTVGSVTTTFNVVRNGRDGAIVTIADFDDEMVSVPTDSTGKARVSVGWNWQTTAHLYKGTEQLELDSSKCEIDSVTNHLWVNNYLTISNDGKTATLQVNGFDDMQPGSSVLPNIDNCKAIIKLTSIDGEIGYATAYVNKIPSGEGSDAVYYNLVVSENAVHATSEDVVTSSQTITINAYKHVGDETPELASENTIINVFGSNDGQNPIGSSTNGTYTLNVASPNTLNNYKVYLNLYDPNGDITGLLLDQETIPVLRDGAQGIPGTPGIPGKDGVDGVDGKDGKDAMAYEFIRFSEDATLVDGVWTGTFTDADSTKVSQKETAQGDTKNLILYSEFGLWNSDVNVPVGWSQNGNASFSYTDEDGVRWLTFNGRNGDNYDGAAQSVETDSNGPKYLSPYDYASTYTISVKYKGSGQVMIGVQYYRWDNSEKQLTYVNDYQEWEYYGAEIADNKEHLLTFTFVAREDSATHLRVFLIHRYGTPAVSSPYIYRFAQPKIEKGSTATDYLPSPKEDLIGTTQGLWKGVLRWSNPYASSDFSLYEWSKVRDAEPRMGTWGEGNCTHIVRTDLPEEDKYFYCGAYGEPYYDIAYDGKDYWLCKKTYRRNLKIEVVEDGATVEKFITPDNSSLWTMYWERASQFNFLMAKTFFAIDAYIEDLAVKKLHTVSVNGSIVSIQDGLITLSGSNGSRFEFGNDADGNAVLRYINSQGVELYDLGPDKIIDQITSQADVWTTSKLVSLGSVIPYQYTTGGSLIPLNTTNMPTSTYYKLAQEGWRGIGANKEYNYSGGSSPSYYQGATFKTNSVSSSNYIDNGWYRDSNTSSSANAYEQVVGSDNYMMKLYRYSNGKVQQTTTVYFTVQNDMGVVVTT